MGDEGTETPFQLAHYLKEIARHAADQVRYHPQVVGLPPHEEQTREDVRRSKEIEKKYRELSKAILAAVKRYHEPGL